MTARQATDGIGSVLALALVLVACGTPVPGTAEAGSRPQTASATGSTGGSTPARGIGSDSTTASNTPSDTATATIPVTTSGGLATSASGEPLEPVDSYVYYLVDSHHEVRLAREIRSVPAHDQGSPAAISAMIAGPLDPDYSSPWNPATRVRGAAVEGGVITVDLSEAARTASVGSAGAAMMIQQLVWTATDAFAAPDAEVRLTIDGEPAGELWGVVTWNKPIARRAAADVRTFVQIDTPREGATVQSPVTVTGDALAFEANVPWRILNEAGLEAVAGFTMTAGSTSFAPFSFDVELDPGRYTIEVLQDDPSDGAAGPPDTDTRAITVVS